MPTFRFERRAVGTVPGLLLLSIAVFATPLTDQDIRGAVDTNSGLLRTNGMPLAPLPATFRQLLQQLDDLIAGSELLEADVAAKQLIEQLLTGEPLDQFAMALVLSRLALVQRLAGQHTASMQNYSATIDYLSHNNNHLSPLLIEPLNGLASVQLASGDVDSAMQTYERALHINHVNYGPHSLRQIDILNNQFEIEVASGNFAAALSYLDRLQRLYQRNYSTRSLELVPVLQRRAELFNMLERFGDERQVYRDIVSILLPNDDTDNLQLINTYLLLADTYLNEADKVVFRSEPTTENGETWLKRALELAEDYVETEPQTLLKCLLALGDYHMILDTQGKARSAYRRAWQLSTSDQSLINERQRLLQRPALLRRPALSPFANFGYGWDADAATGEPLDSGYVVARFSITKRGRTTGIDIVDASPADFTLMETRIERSIRKFIYRPRYEDGAPVVTHGQTFRHEFRYRPSDVGLH